MYIIYKQNIYWGYRLIFKLTNVYLWQSLKIAFTVSILPSFLFSQKNTLFQLDSFSHILKKKSTPGLSVVSWSLVTKFWQIKFQQNCMQLPRGEPSKGGDAIPLLLPLSYIFHSSCDAWHLSSYFWTIQGTSTYNGRKLACKKTIP